MDFDDLNNDQLQFVLSNVTDGLNDLVYGLKIDSENDELNFTINPTIIEKFNKKYPMAKTMDLNNCIRFIIFQSWVQMSNDG